MSHDNPWLSRVVVPLLCGFVGAVAGVLVTAPRDAAAPRHEASPGCQQLAEKVDELRASVAGLRAEMPPAATARMAANKRFEVNGGPVAASARDAEEFRALAKAKIETLTTKMAERQAREDERKAKRAGGDLARLRTIQKNTPPEETHRNVRRWINGLGFSEEDQSRITDPSVAYVRGRTDVIIGLLELAAQGRPASPEEAQQKLKPLETELQNHLPTHLDAEAQAAIISMINEKVRMPYYLH